MLDEHLCETMLTRKDEWMKLTVGFHNLLGSSTYAEQALYIQERM